MLTFSRMKSLLTLTSPKFIAIAPFSVFSNSQLSILRKTTSPLQNRNFLPRTLCLTNSPPNCSSPSNYGHNRGLCSDNNVASGEIHLIVGPMFAGKTTTLLQRMKLASSNGRFGASFFFVHFSFGFSSLLLLPLTVFWLSCCGFVGAVV